MYSSEHLSSLFLPSRNLCVLRAVRAAGGGFRRRRGVRGALCAGSCTLGRVFALTDAARPHTWRYTIAHCMRYKVHVTNSWQLSRTCPVLMLLVLCMGWNFDAMRQISRDFGRDHADDARILIYESQAACWCIKLVISCSESCVKH